MAQIDLACRAKVWTELLLVTLPLRSLWVACESQGGDASKMLRFLATDLLRWPCTGLGLRDAEIACMIDSC